jgi:4-amino-4-deoxy-L-arabinose transferase-like glycosyltransferase
MHTRDRYLLTEGVQSDRLWLAFCFCAALILRLILLFWPEVIHNDGAEYVRAARLIHSGDWLGGMAPPLYPFLIYLTDFLVGDYERAAILVSLAAGTLLVLPVYALAQEIANRQTARLAAVLTVVQPALYLYSGSVLSDATYTLFLTTAILCAWRAISRGAVVWAALFGLTLALSYLVRPEAIVFLIVFGPWAFFYRRESPAPAAKRLFLVLIALAVFAAAASPYLVGLRRIYGSWQISGKATISTNIRDKEGLTIAPELIPDRPYLPKKRTISLWGMARNPGDFALRAVRGFLKALYQFQQVLTPILFLLALIGLLSRRQRQGRGAVDLFLLCHFIALFALVLPLFWITRRHTLQLLPAAIPWAASGMIELSVRMKGRHREEGLWRALPLVLCAVLVAGLWVWGLVLHRSAVEHRGIQKEMGIWMKEHLPLDARVACLLPQEAFYARRQWIRLSDEGYHEVLAEARSKGASHLVLHEGMLTRFGAAEPGPEGRDLKLLLFLERGQDISALYEIVNKTAPDIGQAPGAERH